MKQLHHNLLPFLICAALILITVIAFEPVRHNDFVDYDDDVYVTENPHVSSGITRQSVMWAFTTFGAPGLGHWQPLTFLSHMLDCQLFGLNPFAHHLTNVLLHIANTLLLFCVLKKMTGAVWRSAFVAAAFAVHPLHVESVAWVTERRDVLSGLFWMLAIGAYLRYAERPAPGRYLLVLLAFALGLMAKSMVVTLPFVLLLLDYWPLNRLQCDRQDPQKTLLQSESLAPRCRECSISFLIKEKVPLFLLALVSCIITLTVTHKATERVPLALPLLFRVLNALVSYVRYIEKIIWPTGLAVLYPHPAHKLLIWPTIAALVLLPAVTIRVIRLAKSHGYLPLGWLWYLGTLVPVLGIVQAGSQAMADRYMYLPSVGIFIIVAWGAAELLGERPYRKIALGAAAGLLLAAMVVSTRIQLRHWQNSLTLFSHALKVTENNYVMYNNYGGALFDKGRFEEALVHFNEALRINPATHTAYKNKGRALLNMGKFDEAVAAFSKLLLVRPDWPQAHYWLAVAYARKGAYDKALESFKAALRLSPDSPEVYKDLALVYLQLGNYHIAIENCKEALRLKPDYPQAVNILNIALEKKRKINETDKKQLNTP